jgi:hypothetical protein
VGDRERFSLGGARRAAAAGEIEGWVRAFLASEGSDNGVLAAAIALRECWWAGPVTVDVADLHRLAGPEESLPCPIEPEEWRDEVEAMTDSLDDGWEPPPLLAEHVDGRLVLQDGNHRYEALLESGAPQAWVLLLFEDEETRDAWLAAHGWANSG